MKKIYRRLGLFNKSFKNIVLALVCEAGKHPWSMILDTFVISSTKKQKRAIKYIGKYFSISTIAEGIVIYNEHIKIFVPNELKENHGYLNGILFEYYDIIYPNTVKYPISAIMTEGSYEDFGVGINDGDTIIDVGANIGIFSLYIANKNKKNKIIAFEPIPDLCEIINFSSKINNFSNVISTVPFAIGEKVSKETFYFSMENFGSASKAKNDLRPISVSQTTIDDYVKETSLANVDFIKMDIEGMEPEALRGAKETISNFKPKLAICTYHDPSHPAIIEKMIKLYNPEYRIMHSSHKIFAW